MIEKVLDCMEKYGMFPENGHIVAGISGGADSVCLLRLLVQLRKKYGFFLTAVHVNHGIRAEAGQDAAFVRQLCENWNVAFVLVEADVEALAFKEHLSCEEAGRKVRYEAFAEVLGRSEGKGCIAVAHNSDDRAETLLFHMFRGAGLNGMGSIRPVRTMENGSKIIRPLLFSTRNEIEDFLRREKLGWCTDKTNAEDIYTRNKIRNHILPYVQQQICDRAKEHLVREAQMLSETSDFVRRMTAAAMERCCRWLDEGELCFDIAAFRKEDPFLQQQMIWEGISAVGTARDLTAAHVEQAGRLFEADCISGKKIEIPSCQILAVRQFSNVVMRRVTKPGHLESEKTKENPEAKDRNENRSCIQEVVLKEGSQFVPGLGQIHVCIEPTPEDMHENCGAERTFLQDIPEKKYTKWFDYDKILESVIVRTRRTGDYLTINDAEAKKTLKRYMIEEKIPSDRRDEILVLADGAHIIWVPGYRISAAYKVTAQTKRILKIHLTGGMKDGREN